MSTVVTIDGQQLRFMQCGTCGVWHAFPEAIYQTYEREGGFWHCPNGHRRGWTEGREKTEIEQLRRQRDRLKQDAARLEEEKAAAERSAQRAQGEVRRLKKRAAGGVCPCCNRHFTALERHMKTQHPNVVSLEAVKA